MEVYFSLVEVEGIVNLRRGEGRANFPCDCAGSYEARKKREAHSWFCPMQKCFDVKDFDDEEVVVKKSEDGRRDFLGLPEMCKIYVMSRITQHFVGANVGLIYSRHFDQEGDDEELLAFNHSPFGELSMCLGVRIDLGFVSYFFSYTPYTSGAGEMIGWNRCFFSDWPVIFEQPECDAGEDAETWFPMISFLSSMDLLVAGGVGLMELEYSDCWQCLNSLSNVVFHFAMQFPENREIFKKAVGAYRRSVRNRVKHLDIFEQIEDDPEEMYVLEKTCVACERREYGGKDFCRVDLVRDYFASWDRHDGYGQGLVFLFAEVASRYLGEFGSRSALALQLEEYFENDDLVEMGLR
jgi:hypothetical protein